VVFGAKDVLDLAMGFGVVRAVLDGVDVFGADVERRENLIRAGTGDENLGFVRDAGQGRGRAG
jgi:hypothetical protein